MGQACKMAPIHHELAPAKLTLSLKITGRRADGYHLIASEMVSLDLTDELWIDEGESGLEIEDAIAWIGPPAARPTLVVPTDTSNLVSRALELAEHHAGVRLLKRIPAGAGLGGGSSDAASVLRCFGFTDVARAAQLGADIPFCITGGRALVTGVGEVVEPLADISEHIVVVTPSFGVVTRDVYDAFDDLGVGDSEITNDLEPAALVVEPRLVELKRWIATTTGEAPILAGSGGSFFLRVSAGDWAGLADALEADRDDSIGPVVISRCRTSARQSD